MEVKFIPEPYVATGYTGHIPGARHRVGKTLSYLSHKLFLDPCTPHSPNLIVTNPNREPLTEGKPTTHHIELLKEREHRVDAVYRHPILPGYEAHIPRKLSKVGERDVVAATLGVLEHQAVMDLYKCRRDSLYHKDQIRSGKGSFEISVGERLDPQVTYQLPHRQVLRRAEGIRMAKCDDKPPKVIYNRFPPPHFLDYDDKNKYIIYGYDGHIPQMRKRFGASHKKLTTEALSEFLRKRQISSLDKWCPREEAVQCCPKDSRGADSRDCPDLDYTIYPSDCSMTPKYSGHLPGFYFAVGKGFGKASVNAKGYLEKYRNKDKADDWDCHCLKIFNPPRKVCCGERIPCISHCLKL